MNSKKHTVNLSIVIPAYNEEKRLVATLQQLEEMQRHKLRFWNKLQVIIVCDGCQDRTEKVANQWSPAMIDKLIVSYKINKGKGGALQAGMSHTYGQIVSFIDADGSTNPNELPALAQNILNNKSDIVIGSRRTRDAVLPCKQPWWRGCLGSAFVKVTTLILNISVKVCQCGYKLFDGALARSLYAESTTMGFAIDLEILYMATKGNYRIHEQGIRWQHIEGSTVSPLKDGIKMLYTVIKMRFISRQPTQTLMLHSHNYFLDRIT